MPNSTEVLSEVPTDVPSEKLIEELGKTTLPLMWTLRQEASRAFEPLGFRTVRALLLELVSRGHTQPKDLAGRLGLVPPAVSTIIADLEQRGLLTRQSDPDDGRRVQLQLTSEGEATQRQLSEAWRQVGRKRLSSFSDEELELFVHLCRKLMKEA